MDAEKNRQNIFISKVFSNLRSFEKFVPNIKNIGAIISCTQPIVCALVYFELRKCIYKAKLLVFSLSCLIHV